jgi:hypothetical protein
VGIHSDRREEQPTITGSAYETIGDKATLTGQTGGNAGAGGLADRQLERAFQWWLPPFAPKAKGWGTRVTKYRDPSLGVPGSAIDSAASG